MSLCSAPSSPLTPLSFIPHNHLGTSKPPDSGGLTLTNTAGTAKPVPEAHRLLKCRQGHPKPGGSGPFWDRNAQDQDAQVAPSVLETQQSSLSQGLSQKGLHIKEGTLHLPLPSLITAMLSQPCLSGSLTTHRALGPGGDPSRPPPAPPGCPGGGSRVQRQFPRAKELGPSRHALLKPHQPSY